MSRREILARNRYEYIILQHHLEEIKTQLRNLETLGEGMTTMDYEALHMAHVNYKDKLDERDRELEKLRCKYVETRCCFAAVCINIISYLRVVVSFRIFFWSS